MSVKKDKMANVELEHDKVISDQIKRTIILIERFSLGHI